MLLICFLYSIDLLCYCIYNVTISNNLHRRVSKALTYTLLSKKMKEMNLLLGNDNGNSEHKIVINGEIIRQPNIFAKIRSLPILDDINIDYVMNNIHDNLIVSIDSPSISTARTYYIGNYALHSGKPLTNIGVGAQNSKIDTDVPVVNTLAQIAAYAAKTAYLADKSIDEIDVNVDMVTGLPVQQYCKKNNAAFLNKYLHGPHKVTVIAGNKRVNTNIKFEYSQVVPESTPTVFYLKSLPAGHPIFKEFNELYNLNVDGSYFENKIILHNALGEGTADHPLTSGIEFNPNFIFGSENGIGHAIDRVLSSFIRANHLQLFTRQDYSEALKDVNNKYHDIAIDFIDDELEFEADIIYRNIEQQLSNAKNNVDIIMVHGGGSILMKEHLYNRLLELGEKTNIKIFYIDSKNAVALEAEGMYTFVNSPLYKALKAKYLNKKINEK